MKNAIDERPLLVCRIENPPAMVDSVDEWMPKHFDDSLDHEAVTSVVSYKILQDFDSEAGLPWILNGHGNRFIIYVADTSEGLMEWVDSAFLREAIDDGEDRESSFPELDGEPFTGNFYESSTIHKPLGVDFPGPTAILVERFQVGPETDEEFTTWLEDSYAPRWAALPEAIRVRTYLQKTGVPDRFPYNRYTSKGNRMLLVELPVDTDLVSFARRDDVADLLRESLNWDVRLPYVRREVGVNHVLRDKEDAKSTLAARRAEQAT